MLAGKQPQSPGSNAAVEEKNKKALLECAVCMHDLPGQKLGMFECGHVFCSGCVRTLEQNAALQGDAFHNCPVCRMVGPISIPTHYAESLIAVVVQQDATLAAVQAEAAGAAANASIASEEAAAELAAVRADAARAAATAARAATTAAAELAALKAKHAPPAPAAAAGSGSGSSRLASAAAKKARDSSELDEVEKSMWQVDKEKETLNRMKREKLEEKMDKDWNPKKRR